MQINRITPEIRELASGLQFPEGPIALPDGSVILVEMRRQTLSRVTPAGAVEVIAELGGGPNGAALGPDGLIFVANNGGAEWIDDGQGNTLPLGSTTGSGSIQVVEPRTGPRTGKVRTLYDRCDGRPIGRPNDLVFDDHGGFWFTDFGTYLPSSSERGGVYYARADGSRIERRFSPDHPLQHPLQHPNGIGLSPDGKRLYIAETPTGRCLAHDLEAPGVPAAGDGHVLAVLDGQFLDSLAVDGAGHVCVATLVAGAVSDIWPDGARVDQYLLPDPVVTNVCFGGPDARTAFATLSMHGRLVAFDWPRPGLPLRSGPF